MINKDLNAYYVNLGKRIKALRVAKGWSGKDLAAASKLSAVTINNIENGKIPNVAFENLKRIASAVGIPFMALIDEEAAREAATTLDKIRELEEKLSRSL
jgi:transcriptional regulator with XRE-family HTH domain